MILAHLTNITAGAAITSLLGALFILALVFSPKSGLLFRRSAQNPDTRPPARPAS